MNGPDVSGGSFVKTNGVIIAAKKNILPSVKARKKTPITSMFCILLIASSKAKIVIIKFKEFRYPDSKKLSFWKATRPFPEFFY